MLLGGYEELLEIEFGSSGRSKSMVASSGGVRRASGRRDAIPRVLKEGS